MMKKKLYFCKKIQPIMFKKFHKMNNRYLSLIIFILFSQFIFGQSGLGILDLYHDASLSLKARAVTENANRGISFRTTATPGKNLKNERVSLDYANGKLVVTVGSQSFYPELPVWQLVPIAIFANSAYTVAYLAAGDTVNNKEAQCKYHPAFLNSLLGLRLFEADLLNQPDIIWNIPIDAQRNYLLAQSEKNYTPEANDDILDTLYDYLVGNRSKFSSYVLTDKEANITFDIDKSEFKLSGTPYYSFSKTEINASNVNKIRKQLEDCYNEIDKNAELFLQDKYSPELDSRKHLTELLQALEENKNLEKNNPYAIFYIRKNVKTLKSLNGLTDNEIGIAFTPLDNYTNTFKQHWPLLKTYNPLVYTAVENTAQWTAFFRYVSKTNPNNWKSFIGKINNIKITDAPTIKTPTAFEINYFRIFDDLNE
jgi:hypothetical protein